MVAPRCHGGGAFGEKSERTKDEFAQLFALSGFRLNRIVPTERPICVIEAVPGQV
jgi:hypothetical protein